MGVIIVVDRSPGTRKLICEILENEGFQVESVAHIDEFVYLMKKIDNGVDLILMEVSNAYQENLEYLGEIQKKDSNIPVLLMSTCSDKHLVVKSILAGANDFILKPIQEEYFIKKVMQNLKSKTIDEDILNDGIKIDFNKYIAGEFKKAVKGKYEVLLLYITFKDTLDRDIDNLEYYKLSEIVFNILKNKFWDTDLTIRYGSRSMIGVFPFCDEVGIDVLKTKIFSSYKNLVNDQRHLKGFEINIESASFPKDGETKSEIFDILIQEI